LVGSGLKPPLLATILYRTMSVEARELSIN